MPRAALLYVAAGAGLGHVTRACAVALQLARWGVESRILSHSRYAAALRGLTGCTIDFLPADRWVREAPAVALALQPRLVVLDTFPWGLRGEWRGVTSLRFATLARRLNVEAYLKAIAGTWDPRSPTLARILACEPLDAAQRDLLALSGGVFRDLPGRIRFPAEDVPTPVPAELAALLDRGRACLVVHSGPPAEVEALIRQAGPHLAREESESLAVIAPQPVPGRLTFDYFPAARLYGAAARIVTAGGYNSVAELARFPHKRLCFALPRRYDEQAARLTDVTDEEVAGSPTAGEVLREFLEG